MFTEGNRKMTTGSFGGYESLHPLPARTMLYLRVVPFEVSLGVRVLVEMANYRQWARPSETSR